MAEVNKRYQLENIVQDWTGEIVVVKEVRQTGLLVKYANDSEVFLEWRDLEPVLIRKNTMIDLGFSVVGEKVNPFHIELSMATMIRGKFYNAKGYLYDDRSLWTFHGVSVLYIHQVQNIMSIIDPTISLGPPYSVLLHASSTTS